MEFIIYIILLLVALFVLVPIALVLLVVVLKNFGVIVFWTVMTPFYPAIWLTKMSKKNKSDVV